MKRLLVASVAAAAVAGCGSQTRTVTVTTHAATATPLSTEATTTTPTTPKPSTNAPGVGADGGGRFESCPAGESWVMAASKCIHTGAKYVKLPSWVAAAWRGCPAGEKLIGTGVDGQPLARYGNDGCVGSSSGECAMSEPTCDPANAPGTTPAVPTTTTAPQPRGTCFSFPVYGANADPGQGLFWVTVTASGVCLAQASYSDVGPGIASQQEWSYQDPLTKGNAPPSGFYEVFPGYEGSPWSFTPAVPK